MPPGHLDLLFNQVEIVEEPFGRGSDAPAGIHGQGRAIEGPKALLVLAQAGQQPVGAVPGRDSMVRRKDMGMAPELFDAEQLGPQGRLARTRSRLPGSPVLPA